MQPIISKQLVSRFIATYLLSIIMLTCQITFGQSNTSAKWGRFNLLEVDTTWQYKSGLATPAFFSPAFNDETWQTVSNNYLGHISPTSINWRGI